MNNLLFDDLRKLADAAPVSWGRAFQTQAKRFQVPVLPIFAGEEERYTRWENSSVSIQIRAEGIRFLLHYTEEIHAEVLTICVGDACVRLSKTNIVGLIEIKAASENTVLTFRINGD